LKAPSGITAISLPWRDLQREERNEAIQESGKHINQSLIANTHTYTHTHISMRYSQQAQRLEAIESFYRNTPQSVVA